MTLLLIIWVVCAVGAGAITNGRGRGWLPGVLLGGLLGLIGVIITLFMRDQRPAAVTAGALPRPSMYRECPHCKEQMRRDASVCPHCRMESRRWQIHQGDWWVQSSDGKWYYLDETANEWISHEAQEQAALPVGAVRSAEDEAIG